MATLFEARTYWLDRLQGCTVGALPFWQVAAEGARAPIHLELDATSAARLQALTGGQPLLRLATLVVCTQAALSVHTGQAKLVVGVAARPVGDQPAPANLLPIVQAAALDLPMRELLGQVRRALLDAFAVQDSPLRPLFQELGYSDGPAPVAVVLDGFSGALDPAPAVVIRAQVDEARARLTLTSERAFAPDALRLFLDHVARILAALVRDHGVSLRKVALLTDAERQAMDRWNATDAALPAGSVVDWIQQRAAARPAALALAGACTSTYGALNARANRMARRLVGLGVGRETRVALHLAEPEAMIVALLAVLKAGGAYVPLDPSYPAARIAHMLADSAPAVVVSAAAIQGSLPDGAHRVLSIHELDASGGAEPELDTDLGTRHLPGQLAYIIYTSGSTGRPRGVLVSHGGLANTIHYFGGLSRVDAAARVSQFCSFSFDASVLEIFVALTGGATLCVAPPDVRAGVGLAAFLRAQRVTVVGAVTPAVLSLVPPDEVPDVRALHIGADRCPAHLADAWAPRALLVNCYGPTEATIDCLFHPCQGGEGDPPIGRPIANARAYVLDDELQLAPLGVVGELYVGGQVVARGYQNLPGVTAEKFVPDPFGAAPGQRLYRSGDLARQRADGRVEFCGRADRQVKIDGLRIEPGELEAALARHPGVRQCVVDARDVRPGQRGLVAYIVPHAAMPSAKELRDHLGQSVPAYMLPSAFVALDQLPINANGKLDRGALPEPRADERPAASASASAGAAGGGAGVERVLIRIWSELLGNADIPRDGNFFELGGRSLDVTRVLSRLAKLYQIEIPLETMFRTPRLCEFAAEVEARLEQSARAAASLQLSPPAPRPARLPLSSAQERLWFLQQVLPEESASLYNGPLPVLLEGKLDRAALQAAFTAIIDRHEVLRTAFRVIGDVPVQEILPRLELALDFVDLTALPRAERLARTEALAEADARIAFQLDRPPLLRAKLVKIEEREHVLLLNVHHIVFDGWSSAVLLNDLSRAYDAFASGQTPGWTPLPLQYADFALWQRRWLASPAFDQQLAYWRKQLHGLTELQLPRAAERPVLPSYRGDIRTFRMSAALRDKLEALSREADVTLYMTLLAGFKALLHRYTGQEDIAIGSPVANRRHADLEQLIGFFVNSTVMRTNLAGTPSFRELLARVRKVTVEAWDHQDIPFEKLVENLQPERVTTHNPMFRAALSLQNVPLQPEPSRELVIKPWETHNKTTKFDLVVAMITQGDEIVGDVEYSSDLFDAPVIVELIELYERLLAYVVEHPDARILDVPLKTQAPVPALRDVHTFDF